MLMILKVCINSIHAFDLDLLCRMKGTEEMQSQSILEVKNICKCIKDAMILDNVSFCAYSGEIVGIVGGNASSKTMLSRAISGMTSIDGGSVMVADEKEKVQICSSIDARTSGIVVLHEDVKLYDNFTVGENIFFSVYSKTRKMRMRKSGIINWSTLYNEAQKLCDMFGFSIDVHRKMATLGFAEKQIVSLLHALALEARILIIDDAFSALGRKDFETVKNVISKMKKLGISILFFSQTLDLVQDIVDVVITIQDGKVTERVDKANLNNELLDKLGVDEAKKRPYPKLFVKKGSINMECCNLSYRHIIKDVSFRVHHGEILGIVGAVGSGRTTLARVLGGDLCADSGDIFMDEKKIKLRNPVDARDNHISVILDDWERYGLIPTFTLEDNLIFPNFNNRFGVKVPLLLKHKDGIAYVRKMIDMLAIKCAKSGQDIRTLSAGSQRKVLFARALAAKAELFVLDEPTREIDLAGKIQIYNLLNDAVMIGKSIILMTSDIWEAVGMCDHIFVLRDGKFSGEWYRDSRRKVEPDKIYNELYSLIYKN